MNPAEWLLRTAKLKPTNPALYHGEDLVADYAEFARRAAAIAGALSQRGIGTGDRVAVLMKNCTEYLETMYGIWWAGAAAVPINAKLHAKEAAWIMENAGVRLAFVSAENGAELDAATPTCVMETIVAPGDNFSALYEAPPRELPASLDRDDMIWLFYTSGTTGRPKGVMITAQNMSAMVSGYTDGIGPHSEQDATLYAAPMSHGAGIYNFMHVMSGGRHICPVSGGFDEAEVFELAACFERVSMFAAPTMVRRMIDHAKAGGATGDGLDNVIYAGGPMYFADIVEAVEVLGPRFAQIYGQGECPMAITTLPKSYVTDRNHPHWRERLTSVGFQQMVSRVRVVDERGQEVATGEIGEIVVKGDAVMKGYWNNPEATAKTIRDGWLWTGDMGALDQDGFLTMHDRSKDMIISGGSNIYPREVEEILLSHSGVAEVAVIGRPHSEWGEVVVACVVAEVGQELDLAALDALCTDNIARFKRPKDYVVMQELPKNNYGKVVKTELREMVAAIP
ncbi:AMP-binding protein [uncultured Shimia sp.]|uniref:class I adenylate-forming enzyme family protein n=1 Tax=uncultured Shimia sp. TaxID=573152 RepID=UPI0025F358CC|nr:AMP-binding protein [uncultured Shimia sp.]